MYFSFPKNTKCLSYLTFNTFFNSPTYQHSMFCYLRWPEDKLLGNSLTAINQTISCITSYTLYSQKLDRSQMALLCFAARRKMPPASASSTQRLQSGCINGCKSRKCPGTAAPETPEQTSSHSRRNRARRAIGQLKCCACAASAAHNCYLQLLPPTAGYPAGHRQTEHRSAGQGGPTSNSLPM